MVFIDDLNAVANEFTEVILSIRGAQFKTLPWTASIVVDEEDFLEG
jgi:hypothetical protein